MSFQDSNQQPFGPPPQQPGQSGQQQPGPGWGQPQAQPGGWGDQQQGGQQQAGWGEQQSGQQQSGWGDQQQGGQQGGWGGQPQAAPVPDGSGGWGSQQPQIPRQPNYGFGQQSGGGQSFGQPQDYVQPGYPQQGYASAGYGTGQPGYPPQQSDFGSGSGYGPNPGYPGQVQRNSGLATTTLWLGILGGWGLINLVIGILAINDTGPGKKLGRNKAITGLCLTVAWIVVWVGIALAVSSHAGKVVAEAGPTASLAASPAASSSAGGLSANGANGDPGCQAAESAFTTYSQNATSGGLGAIATLGNTLESAAGQSRVASSQLKAMGQDYIQLSNANTPSSMVTDLEALDTACAMSFTVG